MINSTAFATSAAPAERSAMLNIQPTRLHHHL
ncbi:hypothetical protein ACUW8P_001272 [Corynebacterium afermentans]